MQYHLIMRKLKVILDTNIIFSGLYSSKGASFQAIKLLSQEKFEAALSVTLLFEYEDVLRRNAEMLNLSLGQIEQVLDSICDICSHQKVHFLWRPFLKDPKDDHVLELAVAANADFIVTHNIKDFRHSDKFKIKTIPPGKLLEIL